MKHVHDEALNCPACYQSDPPQFRGGPATACRGCGEPITNGVLWVTVTRARHVISVPSHEHHRAASHAAALEDTSWQRDQSHYGGEP